MDHGVLKTLYLTAILIIVLLLVCMWTTPLLLFWHCLFIDADYSMIPLSMNSENAPVNYDDDDGPVDMGGIDESRLVSTKNALYSVV